MRAAVAPSRTTLAALAALAAIAGGACQGDVQGGGGGTGGGTGGPGSGGSNGGTGSATGSGGAGFTLQCPQPNAGSPLMRALTRNELQNTLGDIFPEVRGQWTSSLPASTVSSYGFDNDGSLTIGKQLASALLDTAESVATAVVGTPLASILPCSTGAAADRSCADQFVTKYGRRLFRRPLTPAEKDRFLGFFDASRAKADFKAALKWTLVGLIQSPNTVYRSEVGAVNGGMRQLSPHEVATALAFTYTGTAPDEALLAKADSGNLGDLVAIAKSMLATDLGKQSVHRFFEGYVEYTRASSIGRPNITTPRPYTEVSADMVQETRAFLTDVILNRGGGVRELLTAPTTNPSAALATYYGFPAPASNYGTVTRPAGRGIGILAQGAFLASHASPDASSPTRRGLFPFTRLLCRDRLSVPDNVPNISQPQPGVRTTRQRYEELHAGPSSGTCATCHTLFDPIGFAFEHYDEGGKYRATEGGLPINAAATVLKADRTPLFSFDGQEDLATKLAADPTVHQCLAAHLAAYAFGTTEACIGASRVTDLQSGAIGIVEAFAQLAAEPHFTRRNAN